MCRRSQRSLDDEEPGPPPHSQGHQPAPPDAGHGAAGASRRQEARDRAGDAGPHRVPRRWSGRGSGTWTTTPTRSARPRSDDVETCFPFKDSPTVSWINVDGLHDVELIRDGGRAVRVAPPHARGHRLGRSARQDGGVRRLRVRGPAHAELGRGATAGGARSSSASSWASATSSPSRSAAGDVFERVRERLRDARGRIRHGAPTTWPTRSMDAVVDHYFAVLEAVGDVTEELEAEVLDDPRQSTMHRLHSLKRELISVRRAVWPLREMLAQLLRSGGRTTSPRRRSSSCGTSTTTRCRCRDRGGAAGRGVRGGGPLPVHRGLPHQRGHEGADDHGQHLHPAHVPRRASTA